MNTKRTTYIKTDFASYYTRIYSSIPEDSPREKIVLVHGLGISGTYMHKLAVELAKKYLVYVPDLPGFGKSSKLPHTLTIWELADALIDWAGHFPVDKAFYLGNSTGCQVITEMAIHKIEKIKGIILQGPAIDPFHREAWEQIMRFVKNSPSEPHSQVLIMLKDYTKCGIRRVRDTLDFALRYPTEEYLPQVNVPALVVRGELDQLVTQGWAEKAAELLPQGSLKIIPQAAHTVNYSAPEELARVSDEFIENLQMTQILDVLAK